jgi:RNA polymerase sigma-70 factor (ECF subfamily)
MITLVGAPADKLSPADAAMDRYAAGDDAAFEIVFNEIGPRLFGFLCRHTPTRERAEDILQHTFEKIHRARGSFISGSPVLPWALAISRPLTIDAVRHDQHDVPAPDPDENPEEALTDPLPGKGECAPAADDVVHARQLARKLQHALSKIPESQRTAFELVKQEELCLAEAAAVLGTTVTAVKLRLHRAYEALRAALGDDFILDGDDT